MEGTNRQVNERVLKVARSLSAQQFRSSFLPALEKDPGNAILARELTDTMRQARAKSRRLRGCRVCRLRDRVDPRRLADQLLAGGLITRGLYDDLRERTLSTDEVWERIFMQKGRSQSLVQALREKFPDIHAEMSTRNISSLDCHCRRLSRGSGAMTRAQSEGYVVDMARLPDLPPHPERDTLPVPEYRMTSSKRGYCLLVVNTAFTNIRLSSLNMEAYKTTHAALRGLFIRLGFDLIERENLSSLQLMTEARKVAQMDHSASDCLAVVLLSRSGPADALHCSDGADVTVEAVKGVFAASRCPSLAGKPKLLYRPGNRGPSEQRGVCKTDEEGDTWAVPDDADFLVMETCPPGCETAFYADDKVFTHVELLAAVLERHGHEQDFLSCLTMVNKKMSRKHNRVGGFHTAPIHSTLTKKLKFPLRT